MMNHIKTFEHFVTEAKQVGTLYHFTTILGLLKILDEDLLGDRRLGKHATVSLTRDRNFDKRTKLIPTEARIQVDGTRLSTRYRIKPYQWNALHFTGKRATPAGAIEDQMEEEVQGYISNITRYIQQITLDRVELEAALFDDDFTDEAAKILNIPGEMIRVSDVVEYIQRRVQHVEVK